MNNNVVCLSGGAVGSDALFAKACLSRDIKTLGFSFPGHVIDENSIRIELSEDYLRRYEFDYHRIARAMGRIVSNKPFIKNLILRDFVQVLGRKGTKTELVVAISSVDKNGRDVCGGTGYAVHIAMEYKIPVVLIDKYNDYKFKFFDYDTKSWRALHKEDLFKIKKGFTGIGSRDIDISKASEAINKVLNCIL